jgi:hypothetical protein
VAGSDRRRALRERFCGLRSSARAPKASADVRDLSHGGEGWVWEMLADSQERT